MADGGMGPMMGWMVGVGEARGKVVKVIVIVLAAIGALTLAGAAAALIMHFGMMATGCCA